MNRWKVEAWGWAKLIIFLGIFLTLLAVAIVKEFAPTVAFLKYIFGS